MVRSYSDAYAVWLTGYYDDFNSARAVADDLNSSSARTMDDSLSHHGNIMTGFAKLNPRYKYSKPDRGRNAAFLADSLGLSSNHDFLVETAGRYTANAGVHEWLTLDTQMWELIYTPYFATTHLQYPDSRFANRQPYNVDGTVGYTSFVNGYQTNERYYAKLGNNDVTHGRSHIVDPDHTQDTGNNYTPYAGAHFTTVRGTNHQYRSLSLASVFMGEEPAVASTSANATKMLYPLKSPSGMPFLVHKNYDINSGTNVTLLTYDGDLRMVGMGEHFHMRIASHEVAAGALSYKLIIGYNGDDATFNKTTQAWDVTNHVAEITIAQSAFQNSGDMSSNTYTAANNDAYWLDVDVIFDFVTRQYETFFNGASQGTTAFGANSTAYGAANGWNPSTVHGWELQATYTNGSDNFSTFFTLIDRVGVIYPISDALTSYKPINSFNYSSATGITSSLTVKVLDDDNEMSLLNMMTNKGMTEWGMMLFRDNIDRPIWRGVVKSVSHTQTPIKNTLETTITAEDFTTYLNTQLPVWEMGQSTNLTLSQHLSLSQNIEMKASEVSELTDAFYFGVKKLKTTSKALGFDNTSSFYSAQDTRTSLYSGHPIQMYLNEDTNGPNNLEANWEGIDSTDFQAADLHGIMNARGNMGDNDHVVVAVPAGSAFTANLRARDIQIRNTGVGTLDVATHAQASGSPSKQTTYVATDAPSGMIAYDIVEIDTPTNFSGTAMFNDGTVLSFHIKDYEEGGSEETLIYGFCNTGSGLTIGQEVTFAQCPRNTTSHAYDTAEATTYFEGLTVTVCGLDSNGFYFYVDNIGQYFSDQTGQYVFSTTQDNLGLFVRGFGLDYGDPQTGFNIRKDTKPSISYDDSSGVAYPGVTSNAIYGQGTDELQGVKSRNLHSRWIRDLAESKWFRQKFGIIKEKAFVRGGKSSHTETPIYGFQASAFSVSQTSTMQGLSSDLAVGASTATFDDPSLFYWIKLRGRPGIVDLFDPMTGERNTLLCDTTSTPTSTSVSYVAAPGSHTIYTTSYEPSNVFQVANTNIMEVWDKVVHTNFPDGRHNGVFTVVEIINSTQYVAVKNIDCLSYRNFTGMTAERLHFDDRDAMLNRYEIDVGGSRLLDVQPLGVPYALNSDISPSGTTVGTVYYGTFNLTGVKGQKRSWTAGNTLYCLRELDESNGYKHCWVLWADMRNDGRANADFGYRKNSFGLLTPTNKNYTVKMQFADQFDADGNPMDFVELKIGHDVDIWAMDSDSEPYTGSRWSALGSDNEDSHWGYDEWDETGGAFVVVDASRFFNLNTEATGGKSGYSSGGMAHFDDFDTPISGFPYLLDNYYLEGMATYKNSGTLLDATTTQDIGNHPNQLKMINDGVPLASDISIGDTTINVFENTNFNQGASTDGYGVILAYRGSGRNAEFIMYSMRWRGVNTSNTNRQAQLTNVFISQYEGAIQPSAIIAALDADSGLWSGGSDVDIKLKQSGTADGFDKVVVYNTPAALYGLRMKMVLEGYVQTEASGSYFDSDKLRILQNLCILDNWGRTSHMRGLGDINNFPITSNMNTTQLTHTSVTDVDSFGSVQDARRGTFLNIVDAAQKRSGLGKNRGLTVPFSRVPSRDGRFDYRPSYDTKLTFDRNNMMVANLQSDMGTVPTNVRVYYNGNLSFADYPDTTTGSDGTWTVIDGGEITMREEALSLAKETYLRLQDATLSVTIKPSRRSNDNNIMLTGARFGYLADPCRVALTPSGIYGLAGAGSWTSRFGNIMWPGMVDGTEGSLMVSEFSASLIEELVVWDYSGSYSPASELAGCVLLRYASDLPTATGHYLELAVTNAGSPAYTLSWKNSSGVSQASHEVSAGGNFTFTNSGDSFQVEVNQASLPSRPGSGTDYYRGNISFTTGRQWRYAYPFYGVNSLSKAMQIVHIPRDVPKVSDATGSEIRFAISVSSGTTWENCIFKVHAIDYTFANTGTPAQFTSTLNAHTSVDVYANGFHELAFPANYGAQGTDRMIISVNVDYLRTMLKIRGGFVSTQPYNAHNITGVTSYGTTAASSPFPLGMREYSEYPGMATDRAEWYAPRLHVVDDIAFMPSTKVTFTDTHLDLSSQSMNIKSISWTQIDRKHEEVTLELERNETRFRPRLANLFGYTGSRPADNPRPRPQPPFGPLPSLPGGPPTTSPPTSGTGPLPNFSSGYGGPGMGDTSSLNFGMGMNDLGIGASRQMGGMNESKSDSTASGGDWGVLGQKKRGRATTHDTSISGYDSTQAQSGSATTTSDGFSLPGVDDPEVGAAGELHSHSITIRVPNTAADDIVGLDATVTYESISGGGNAVVTAKVECVETGSSFTRDITIAQGSSRTAFNLMPSSHLNGASTSGNTLKVTLSRKPGQGSDAGPYQSIIVHNISLRIRQNSQPSDAQSDRFLPY